MILKNEGRKTVIIGASMNTSRYAYMAAQRLSEAGHEIKLVSIKKGSVFGESFLDLKLKPLIYNVDTVTLYIGSDNLTQWQDYILSLEPKRIIFNPGTENEILADAAQKQNIEVVFGCTLVMLSTGQY